MCDCLQQTLAFGNSRPAFAAAMSVCAMVRCSEIWQKNQRVTAKAVTIWLTSFIHAPRMVASFGKLPPVVWVLVWKPSAWQYAAFLGDLVRTDKKVTWLILPVVICLSQRLSHACLSINNFILWNCERLIISVIIYLMVPYYMDNCGNSRANTCVKSQLSRGGMYLLDKKPMRPLAGFVVNHSNFSNRMASRRR